MHTCVVKYYKIYIKKKGFYLCLVGVGILLHNILTDRKKEWCSPTMFIIFFIWWLLLLIINGSNWGRNAFSVIFHIQPRFQASISSLHFKPPFHGFVDCAILSQKTHFTRHQAHSWSLTTFPYKFIFHFFFTSFHALSSFKNANVVFIEDRFLAFKTYGKASSCFVLYVSNCFRNFTTGLALHNLITSPRGFLFQCVV